MHTNQKASQAFREAMKTRGEYYAQWMPSLWEFIGKWREGGIDGDFVVELAGMEEEETTAALALRMERQARAYADAMQELRQLLVKAYGEEMRRREGAKNGQ